MGMNRIYRSIWSEALGAWVAVSEITRARGKRGCSVAGIALSLTLLGSGALADGSPVTVVPTGGKTSVYLSANGVPVVNINAANAAGLSHNRFNRYDVASNGLVLNNGNAARIERESLLAGSVLANSNLNKEASVILNEVVSTNRSTLAGFTEVVGSKADVVVANPNGITCSGCGFINTDRATLTTGTPLFNGSGGLDGFKVEGGNVLIQGNGLNATDQPVLDVVARSIKVDAPLVGSASGSVQLIAGANAWSYATRNVTGSFTGSAPAAAYAIDSTALGGMYAGRIRLIASDAGVGVRMLGEAAASAEDFSVNSSGKVVVRARISAKRDLILDSSAADSDALNAADSELTAQRKLRLSAAQGGLTLSGGVLSAGGDIQYDAGTLSDTATSANLSDNNKRYAGGSFTLNVSAAAAMNGVTLAADRALNGSFGDLDIGAAGATLHAYSIGLTTAGAMNLGAAIVHADTDLTVATTRGDIVNNGFLLSGNSTNITASGSITNTGAIAGLKTLDITTSSGDLVNAGLFYAGTRLSASSLNGTFTNTDAGSILSAGDINLQADNFVNHNWVEAAVNISITTTKKFLNAISGTVTGNWTLVSGPTVTHQEEENDSCHDCDYMTVWEDKWHIDQQFVDNVGRPIEKTVAIVAGGNLAIDYNLSKMASANNIGATLYAGKNISIDGLGTFNNTDIELVKGDYDRRWAEIMYDAVASPKYYYYYAAADSLSFEGIPSFKNNIFAVQQVKWPTKEWDSVGHNRDYASPMLLAMARDSAYHYPSAGSSVATTTLLRSASVKARGTVGILNGAVNNQGITQLDASAAGPENPDPHDITNDPRITIPSNPYGYFVPSRNSSAHYLIETNPLYGLGSDQEGSGHLLKSLGIDPEGAEKRLGDANYEAYLIRQQLIDRTGSAVLKGYASESAQLTRLMDQAAAESKSLGLRLGEPLSAEQIASLKQDMVWMVETTVAGQKVLAPVVYLAEQSRRSIVSGTVIEGNEIAMNVTSLNNRGGSIRAAKSLSLAAEGDIRNISGSIRGADVTLESRQGSIESRTLVETQGDNYTGKTDVGKVARIDATGKLTMSAAGNVSLIGADVKAGGSGSITAGKNIVADTVVDKTATTATIAGTADFLSETGPVTTTTVIERNIGTTLATGGNLTLKSGGSTTLAGTKADVGGNLAVTSGGDVSLLSRQDKTTTHSESTTRGIGVGGGLFGSQKTTVDDASGTNVGSSVNVAGDTKIKSKKDVTLQGSDLTVGGRAKIRADSVQITQGLDERRTITRTDTTTFLSSGGTNKSDSSSSSSAESGHGAAEAAARGDASANESHEFNFVESRTITVDRARASGVASHLTTGGKLTIDADKDVGVTGSEVAAGEKLKIVAQRLEVKAGESRDATVTTSETTKFGIYSDSKADATANAEATATGKSVSANATAEAKAKAESTVTAGIRLNSSTETTTEVTHTVSTLKSGDDMLLKASKEAKFIGADVEAVGDLKIKGRDITSLAAQDSKVSTTDSTTRTMGVYLDGGASAQFEASGKGGVGNLAISKKSSLGVASASAEGAVEAEASFGLRYAQEHESSVQGKSAAVVNAFKAGGDITRNAKGVITDQGTQLEAGGDIRQKATTVEEVAAQDKSWSAAASQKHDAKLGIYAGGSVDGEGAGHIGYKGTDSTKERIGPDASAGIQAKYSYEGSSETHEESTARTSSYKAGGSIQSKTSEKTTLIGTQFDAGKNVTIQAGSLDFQAAHDIVSDSSTTRSGNAQARAKIYGTTGLEASVGYEQNTTSATKDTARAGSIGAGGNVTIKTRDDTRLEGTVLGAQNKVEIRSDSGAVSLDAARSTTHAESSGFKADIGFGTFKESAEAGKKSGGEQKSSTKLGGGYTSSSADTMKEEGARIRADKIVISADKDVTLYGAELEAKRKASVTAGGNVSLLESRETENKSSFGVSANAKQVTNIKPESNGKTTQRAGVNVKVASEEHQTGKATSLSSGGQLTLQGRTITSQEAQLAAGRTTILGTLDNTPRLTNVDKGTKIDIGVDVLRKKGLKHTPEVGKAVAKPAPKLGNRSAVAAAAAQRPSVAKMNGAAKSPASKGAAAVAGVAERAAGSPSVASVPPAKAKPAAAAPRKPKKVNKAKLAEKPAAPAAIEAPAR